MAHSMLSRENIVHEDDQTVEITEEESESRKLTAQDETLRTVSQD